MIKNRHELKGRPIEIDLSGPDGNAYVLMGYARSLAKQIFKEGMVEREERLKDNAIRELMDLPDMTSDWMTKQILDEMMESDYENLLEVFDKYFGSFVILYR